jgi:hypothetical protein
MADTKEFNCNSRQLADYLIKRGSKLLRIDDGVFVFEYDDSIDFLIEQWKLDYKRCMF